MPKRTSTAVKKPTESKTQRVKSPKKAAHAKSVKDAPAKGKKTPAVKSAKTASKKPVVAKVSEKKTKKVKVEEVKPKRKINMNPTLSAKAGLNISVARVKNIVDAFILNKEEYTAAQEVRSAHNRVEKDKEGVESKLPSIPVADLSAETQDLIVKAKYYYDRSQREAWEKTYLGKLSVADLKIYNDTRKVAKDAFEDAMRVIPEFERGVFDLEAFNVGYNADFYKGFVEVASKEDEWHVALNQLSKLRVRFSANSKILLSSFIELLLSQLAVNGTYHCVQSGKKIIKLSHALTLADQSDSHFTLFPMISNTHAYRRFLVSQTKTPETTEDDAEDVEDDVEDDDETRPNFRFYVSEICRDIRMKMADESVSVSYDKTEDKTEYNLTNVSRDFKDFCNSLIFEMVSTLGRMILTEINTRGVKTLNDVIMKTVIEHMHSAYGLNFTQSLGFIETATTKYNEFVKTRRSDRKTASTAEGAESKEGFDVEYAEE